MTLVKINTCYLLCQGKVHELLIGSGREPGAVAFAGSSKVCTVVTGWYSQLLGGCSLLANR